MNPLAALRYAMCAFFHLEKESKQLHKPNELNELTR